MNINIHQLYKKFNLTWVIKDFSYTFVKNQIYALTGHNGSGKSTLINIIAGLQQASKGKIEWILDDKDIKKENIFRHISLCSPSMELIEEMTLSELLLFHFTFKRSTLQNPVRNIIHLLELQQQKDQKISEYSSGMKQRVKLAQAFFSDTPLLLLDEPTSYLDEYWIEKYQSWLEQYTKGRTCIIASNDHREYQSANEVISLVKKNG